MNRFLVSFTVAVLLILCAVGQAPAAPAEIELKDGSKLVGEVISSDGGVYRINSDALGTVEIQQDRIKALRFVSPGEKTGSGADEPKDFLKQVQRAKDRIASDKGLSDMILSLQEDPDFQEALKDPELMRAAEAGDLAALLSNPKMLKLMTKPEVLDIGTRMAE